MNQTEKINLLTAINNALDLQLAQNSKVVVFGEDIGKLGGVFRVTAGLQHKYGEQRVFSTPISECAIIGTAVGMAMNGLIPVPEIQFDGFLPATFGELMFNVSRMRNRTRGSFSCPMTVRVPVGGGVKALECHSESLESMLGSIPGIEIVVPSNPYDAKGLLIAAINSPNPTIYMEPKALYRGEKQEIPLESYEVEIGKANVVKEGTDLTLITWSSAVKMAQKAIMTLEQEGISVELIDLRTIYPLDETTILKSVKKTGRLVVAHEAKKTYGPAGELIALVNEHAWDYLKIAPLRITGYDIIMPLGRGEHHQMISPDKIIYKIKQMLAKN